MAVKVRESTEPKYGPGVIASCLLGRGKVLSTYVLSNFNWEWLVSEREVGWAPLGSVFFLKHELLGLFGEVKILQGNEKLRYARLWVILTEY